MPEPVAIIGDIHGCFDELLALEAELDRQFPGGIRRVFVGDLLDKGPKQIELLDYVIEKGYDVVMGNHEDKHRRFKKHDIEKGPKNNPMRKSRRGSPVSGTGGFVEINELLTADHYAFLCSLPLAIRIPEWELIVIHAGIPAAMQNIGTEVTAPFITLAGKTKKFFGTLCWTRFISGSKGMPVMLGKEGPEDSYWAEVYDGRFGTAVFGHQPFKGPAVFPFARGVDTGCVFGDQLSCIVYTDDDPDGCFISVEALAAHAEPWGPRDGYCIDGKFVRVERKIKEIIG